MDETTLTEHHDSETTTAPPTPATSTAPEPATEVDDELLVEEISIDGMCGVY